MFYVHTINEFQESTMNVYDPQGLACTITYNSLDFSCIYIAFPVSSSPRFQSF
ncbi:hypothetical protein HanIR_Chr01g0000101 [Helianthus annuus]|nr:hypothetical protein HanIR_Chr01g0000101 [Helianthus annuus]